MNQKRENLIRTGMQLILKNGLQNTSVEDITKACGVAKGTFYYYFKTKEEFIVAATEGVCRDKAFLEANEKETTAGRIRTYLTRYAQVINDEIGIDFGRIWGQLVIQYGNTERYKNDLSQIRTLLERGVSERELREDTDCEALAKLFVTYIYGAAFEWHMGRGENDVVELTGLLTPFVDGILQPCVRESAHDPI